MAQPEVQDLEDELFDEDFEPQQPVQQALQDSDADVEAELFGDDDEAVPAPVPIPAAPAAVADTAAAERRALLTQLASSKRQAETTEDGRPSSKKSKKDKERGPKEGSKRGRLSRRGGEEAAAGSRGGVEERGIEVGLLDDEVDEVELHATEADKAFIDDEGLPEEEAYGSEGEEEAERLRQVDQAEEEGDEPEEGTLEAVLAARKRRKVEEDVDRRVDELVAQLHAAADEDEACYLAKPRRPAIHKLRALEAVESSLRQVKYREPFLYAKGLEALNRWLTPYPDGTPPALKVRTSVLRLLAALPIDAANETMQDVLASSGIGRSVAFYSRKTDEPADNKKLATTLYQKWAAAMLYNPEAERVKRERKAEEHRARLEAERERRAVADAAERQAAQQRLTAMRNDPNYRPRAAVPSAGKMDFLSNPGRGGGSRQGPGRNDNDSGGEDDDRGARRPSPVRRPPGGSNLEKVFIKKKKASMQRQKGHARVSVEGRGLIIRS